MKPNKDSETQEDSQMPQEPGLQEKPKRRATLSLVIAVLLVTSVASSILYIQARGKIQKLQSSEGQTELQQQETEELLKAIGRHILLPEGEPLVATIVDAETLKASQPFYAEAKNGDKLVVYQEKALIYDPDKDVLVNVGPVFVRPQEGVVSDSPEEGADAQVEDSDIQPEGE